MSHGALLKYKNDKKLALYSVGAHYNINTVLNAKILSNNGFLHTDACSIKISNFMMITCKMKMLIR